ncbi:MAG: hypothetical protein H7070_06900 [Saprospiraceae bacterium]|nr:hypothetical protein [Pyrinomonadaceae bacterium]
MRFKFSIPIIFLILASSILVFGQETPEKKDEKKAETPVAPITKDASKTVTAEQIAETVILATALPGGRATLNQIRKTAIERGTTSVSNAEGKMEKASYQKFTSRGESMGKEKIRLDQEFPTARYSLVYNEDKIFGIFNDEVFAPREDASRSFQNQIVYGLEALLRYKENESKLELGGRDKILGVDFYFLDVTDKQNRKTRFYVSSKTFRVMMLDYADEGVKYRRKFYDYNYAQGTLVPYRSVLWAGDKMVEETEIGTVTYGQKVDDGLFAAS